MLDPDRPPAERNSPLEVLRVVWERKWIVLATTLVCIGAALAYSLTTADRYTAESQILFRDPGFARTFFGSSPFEQGTEPERDTSTRVSVLQSATIKSRVVRELGLARNTDLDELVEITAGENADVVSIESQTRSRELSARMANVYANEYILYARDADRDKIRDAQRTVQRELTRASIGEQGPLRRSLRELRVLAALQTGNAEQITVAEPPEDRSSPKPLQYSILAGLLGLALGTVLALLASALDRRLKSSEDFERVFGWPVITSVPRMSPQDRESAQLVGPQSEPWRMLREALRFLEVAGRRRCLLVTSPDASEGKTTVAVNLARALVSSGQRVVVIEADLRRPDATNRLVGRSEGFGLSGALVGQIPVPELLLASHDHPDLYVLPAGPSPPNPADLFRVSRLAEVVRQVSEHADVVIIDAPPLLPVSDTQVLLELEQLDGVIMVGRAWSTRRDRAGQARRILERSGTPVLGVIVNFARRALDQYAYYDDSREPSTSRNGNDPERARERVRAE